MLSLAAAIPPEPTISLGLGSTILAVGSALFTLTFWVVRALGSRVVKSEDDAKSAIQRQVDAHTAELKVINDSYVQMRADVRQLTSTVDAMRTQLAGVEARLDTRVEKMGEHYREQVRELQAGLEKKLDDVEYRLRQDMTRATADALKAKRGRA